MQLSNETLAVLKNFSTINQGLQFKVGNKLSTVSTGKTVLAEAILKDEFPVEFCVYDLNQFLSVYSLFKDKVDLDFDASNIIFKAGNRKVKYRMTAKEMIVTPPDKALVLPSVDCAFTLSAEDYDWIMKSSSVLSSPHLCVQSEGDEISVMAFDAEDNSSHTNSIVVAPGNGNKYKIVFKTENIKMIAGTYDVKISFKGFGHFKNTTADIQYWVAFESKNSVVV